LRSNPGGGAGIDVTRGRVKAARFDYVKANDCAEAVRLLVQSGGTGKVMAGCQSLGPMLNLRLAQPELLVDIRTIPEFTRVSREGATIMLGACICHAAIEDMQVPDATRGLMPFVARGIAYRAVRNRGTLGGSLAHADPAADWVTVMALLDAQYIVTGPEGTRTVNHAHWMQGAFTTALADNEILTAVRIPVMSSTARWSYRKLNRKPGEFADAIAAFVDDPDRAMTRAVIGATDGAPHVIGDAAELLRSWHADAAAPELAAAGLVPGSYEYRVHAVALQRAIADLRDTSRRAA
jgi:aerobic carbon-monoxide dehydrogenase medium subunit